MVIPIIMSDFLTFSGDFFLVVTIALSVLALRSTRVMNVCILNVQKLNQREWFRLLTSGFVHADYIHLAFNMFTYYSFAYLWQDIYVGFFGLSWWWFAVFYLSSIVVVNLFVWIANRKKTEYQSLGASGGVSAVVFSCILFFPKEKLYLFFISLPAIWFAVLYLSYSTYQSFRRDKNDRINHFAHLVGCLYGVVFSVLIQPDVLRIFIQKLFA